jgi:hypothetical protein
MMSFISSTSPNMKVVIPSKGRAEKITTNKFFNEVTLCVEPQEKDLYNFPKIVLPENNKGIGYSRKFIVDNFPSEKVIAIADDDITGFYEVVNGKLIYADVPNLMLVLEKKMSEMKLGAVGMSTRQNNWYSKKEFILNKKMFNFGMFNLELMRERKINYDPNLTLFEDIDLLIQFRIKGINFGCFHKYAVDTYSYKDREKAGGGCLNAWQVENSKKNVEYLIAKYGNKIIKPKMEGELYNFTVNWRLFL